MTALTREAREALLDDAVETCQKVATLARDGVEVEKEYAPAYAGILRLIAELADAVQVVAIAVRHEHAPQASTPEQLRRELGCLACSGTGRASCTDNTNWIPCATCGGSGEAR